LMALPCRSSGVWQVHKRFDNGKLRHQGGSLHSKSLTYHISSSIRMK
jgi:hypothetical protein